LGWSGIGGSSTISLLGLYQSWVGGGEWVDDAGAAWGDRGGAAVLY
jgi:hypothetical protein